MNRKEIAETIACETHLTVAQAEGAVTALLENIVGTVANGDKVVLSGFGTFERRHRASRSGRHPQTGEAIEIAASDAPAFKPAVGFKRAVAGR